MNQMVQQVGLDRCFAALSDPTRRALVERLAKGEATVSELAGPFDMSLVAVQKHVKVLEGAGLVLSRKHGRSRHVRLAALPMKEAVDWMQRYHRFWQERLDQLADLLENDEPDVAVDPEEST